MKKCKNAKSKQMMQHHAGERAAPSNGGRPVQDVQKDGEWNERR
jgi:hypothetical protein